MFAYCGNNPINRKDPAGCNWLSLICDTIAKAVSTIVETVTVMSQLEAMGFKDSSYQSAQDCTKAMEMSGIDTVNEKAHFFAQCYVEGNLSLLEAGYLSEDAAEAYRKNKSYYPYYGAGYIQLTWDYKYKAFSEYMNDPLIYELGPEYVAENYAWSTAGWFWYNNGINDLIANGGSVADVTKCINGGKSQLDERREKYYYFLGILGG